MNNGILDVIELEQNDKLGGKHTLRQHDKLINAAAKKVLSPQGLFRRGTSRTWVDDNGYFVIFVSFGASNWSQSARLGVGIDFLWKYDSGGPGASFSYSYGHNSIEDFFEYDGNDEIFQAEMERYSEIGLQKVMEYRKFRDMGYAKRCLEQQILDIPEKRRFWEDYNLAMLCFLKGDYENGRKTFETFLNTLKNSFYIDGYYIDWHEKLYQYCLEQIVPYLNSKENAQQMVVDRIKQRRDFLNGKPAFRKFGKEDFILYE